MGGRSAVEKLQGSIFSHDYLFYPVCSLTSHSKMAITAALSQRKVCGGTAALPKDNDMALLYGQRLRVFERTPLAVRSKATCEAAHTKECSIHSLCGRTGSNRGNCLQCSDTGAGFKVISASKAVC